MLESSILNLCQTRLLQLGLTSFLHAFHHVTLVARPQEVEAGERQIGQTVCVDGDLHVIK